MIHNNISRITTSAKLSALRNLAVSFGAVCCVCFAVPPLVLFVPARLACVPVCAPAVAPVGVGVVGLVDANRGP
jgi:hypothetical protein